MTIAQAIDSFNILGVLLIVVVVGFLGFVVLSALFSIISKKNRTAWGFVAIITLALPMLLCGAWLFGSQRIQVGPPLENVYGQNVYRPTVGRNLGESRVLEGGDRWSAHYDESHVADVYSSKEAAAQSLARQCVARLKELNKDNSVVPTIRFDLQAMESIPNSVQNRFTTIFRQAAPGMKYVSEDSAAAIRLAVNWHNSTVPEIATWYVRFEGQGNQEEVSANVTEKPWVRHSTEYSQGSERPQEYLVVRGQTGHFSLSEKSKKHPEWIAATHLTPLITAELPHITRKRPTVTCGGLILTLVGNDVDAPLAESLGPSTIRARRNDGAWELSSAATALNDSPEASCGLGVWHVRPACGRRAADALSWRYVRTCAPGCVGRPVRWEHRFVISFSGKQSLEDVVDVGPARPGHSGERCSPTS